ncbi:translation initiation factor eIF 4e-like domain-containing protein [Crassisporium funariophilum]|nr:translation initiation factor eIF 4e-like domain-containing protein [Crassisporium funariophilum]
MMDAEDTMMMDVDDSVTQMNPPQPTVTVKTNWVQPPTSPDDLISCWSAETSTENRLVQFLTRWAPSRTPASYGPWICADRGGRQPTTVVPDWSGLTAAFQTLVAANNVTVETLDEISKSNKVLVGKWMVFEEPEKIDMLWGKILYHICVERQRGSAKVSTWKEGERHVICVYVEDYTDREEVTALRKALRAIGVRRKIGFKTDAYTHLNIYKDNTFNLRPSRYHE